MVWRILHSEASLGWGGQEIRVWTEVLAMRDRGHRVFLTAPAGSALFKKAREEGLECLSFSARRSSYPASILRLRNWIRKNGIEVVNMHSSRDGYIAGLAARLAGVRCIVRTRHIDVDYPHPAVSRIGFRWIPHHVTTTSERIARRLREQLELPEARTTSIPTGIDLHRFSPDLPAVDPGPFPKIEPGVKKIGMVAVLRSWKGHRFFLKAAKSILSALPDSHFIIAGEGPMEALIRAWIEEEGLSDSVTLTGHVHDVGGLLNSLDVLVLPSTAHEGIPQIILQAQACAVPVVATRVGGIPEVVQDGETGFLAEPENPDALGEAIQKALSDPDLAGQIRTSARQKANREYGLDIMCEKTEALYSRILAKAE